jgi:hypothetical protein
MLIGLADGWVAAAYWLSIVSASLCLVYGALNWNRGDEPVRDEDLRWAKQEKDDVESAL